MEGRIRRKRDRLVHFTGIWDNEARESERERGRDKARQRGNDKRWGRQHVDSITAQLLIKRHRKPALGQEATILNT